LRGFKREELNGFEKTREGHSRGGVGESAQPSPSEGKLGDAGPKRGPKQHCKSKSAIKLTTFRTQTKQHQEAGKGPDEKRPAVKQKGELPKPPGNRKKGLERGLQENGSVWRAEKKKNKAEDRSVSSGKVKIP